MLKLLFAPSVSSPSASVLVHPLAVSSKGCLAILQGMLQEQQQHRNASEEILSVIHHFVLYDQGTILPGSRLQLPAAASLPSLKWAASGAAELLCARNAFNPNICLICECQHLYSPQASAEMRGYGACRVRVSVGVTIDDHRLRAG
jgi:hypothetical protein